jgi:hypothetical protein
MPAHHRIEGALDEYLARVEVKPNEPIFRKVRVEYCDSRGGINRMDATVDLSGQWQVDDGSVKYNARLTQKQDRVVGTYDLPVGHHGHIDGFLIGNVFEFRWDQPVNRRAGVGRLILASDGQTMAGTWSYDPQAYNSGLTGGGRWTFYRQGLDAGLSRLYDRLKARLAERKYLGVERSLPIQWAFLRPAGALTDPRVIAVIDARSITEPPSATFERVKDWFQKTIGGHRGEGLLLFVYSRPPATLVDEIRRSHFYAGSIAVTAGAYDLATDSHWLSYPGPWETDAFGS